MGRMENQRMVDELLSAIAQGYSNGDYIADIVFPVVETRTEKGVIPHYTQESFRYYNTKRAIGADSNRITLKKAGPPISWQLDEHDLEDPVDYREEEDAAFDVESASTEFLTDLQLVRREKDVADLVQNPANYTFGNAATPTTKWDDPDSDPVADLLLGMDTTRGNCGIEPNLVSVGASAWLSVRSHPKVLARLSDNELKVIKPEHLAQILEVKQVVVGKAIWMDDDDVKYDIWTDSVVLSYNTPGVRAQRNIRKPGFGYTLVKAGWPPIDKYPLPGNKIRMVRSTSRETQLFHGNVAGYLIHDTNS